MDLTDYVQRESVFWAREAGLRAKCCRVFAVDTSSVDEVWH